MGDLSRTVSESLGEFLQKWGIPAIPQPRINTAVYYFRDFEDGVPTYKTDIELIPFKSILVQAVTHLYGLVSNLEKLFYYTTHSVVYDKTTFSN